MLTTPPRADVLVNQLSGQPTSSSISPPISPSSGDVVEWELLPASPTDRKAEQKAERQQPTNGQHLALLKRTKRSTLSLLITYVESYERFGRVNVSCRGSCRCSALIDATYTKRRTSEPETALVRITNQPTHQDSSLAPGAVGGSTCTLRVESLRPDSIFKILSLVLLHPDSAAAEMRASSEALLRCLAPKRIKGG